MSMNMNIYAYAYAYEHMNRIKRFKTYLSEYLLDTKNDGNADEEDNADDSDGGGELQGINRLDTEDGEENKQTLDRSNELDISR